MFGYFVSNINLYLKDKPICNMYVRYLLENDIAVNKMIATWFLAMDNMKISFEQFVHTEISGKEN